MIGDMFICLSVADGRPNAGPIKTKLGIGTHVDPRSVLVKVRVRVIWRHLPNVNKTPYRGPQGPREFEAINTADRGPQSRDNSGRRTGTYS